MGYITQSLIIVLSISLFLWFGQLAVLNINPSLLDDETAEQQFFNYNGSPLAAFDAGGHTLNESQSAWSPTTTEGGVRQGTSVINFFTDPFLTIKNWFEKTRFGKFFVGTLAAPYNFLMALHIPQEISFGLGVMWYIVIIFLLLAFFFGRND